MPAFRILVFRNVSPVGRFEEDCKPANGRNNNAVETTTLAVATFLI
jgi:hypothetical protein